MIRRPLDQRPVGRPGNVSPYGKWADASVGPKGRIRIALPVSEIESPNLYIDWKGHIGSLTFTGLADTIKKQENNSRCNKWCELVEDIM